MWDGVKAAHKMRPHALDRPVELKVADTGSNMMDAANAIFRLIERDHVTALIGDNASGSVFAGSVQAARRGIPMLTPMSVIRPQDHLSQVAAIGRAQAKPAAHAALNGLGAITAAVIYDMSDEQSVVSASGFKKEFTEAGGRIVLETRIKSGDREFTAQVNRILTMKPDMIYAAIHHTECAFFANRLREAGLNIPMVASDAAHVWELAAWGGVSPANLLLTSYFHASMIRTDLGIMFREMCVGETHDELQPAHVMAADAYLLAVDAITRAGSAEPAQIREVLSHRADFEGIAGRITLEADGRMTRPLMMTEVKNREFVKWEPGPMQPRQMSAGALPAAVGSK
jgi:branched-chain amino acid transport system substrate-binding protein